MEPLPAAPHRPADHRGARRAARLARAGLLAAGLLLLAAAPAHAAGAPPRVDIDGVHQPLGAVNAILIFGGIPAALAAVLALIFLRPSSAPGAQRYRPGRGWDADPVWFGLDPQAGPNGPQAELGPSAAGEPLVGEVLGDQGGQPRRALESGGARGSW